MSEYTTGEIARLCGITVRTVQYYDTRGILIPDKLSEGGRRLYSENNLRTMKIICFLRELGLPISSISQIRSEENSDEVIYLLLEQQEKALREEAEESTAKLHKLEQLKNGLKSLDTVSVESIGDIAYTMSNKKKLRKIHLTILFTGLPVSIFQLVSVVLWITSGLWWLFVIWAVIALPYGIAVSKYYLDHVAYLCPNCHTIFRPAFKDAFFARHTPSTRKLTCTACGHHGFCVEVAAEEEKRSEKA